MLSGLRFRACPSPKTGARFRETFCRAREPGDRRSARASISLVQTARPAPRRSRSATNGRTGVAFTRFVGDDRTVAFWYDGWMDIDEDKIDDAVLALLWLTLHDERRAWKSFDWAAMDRLHAKGLIADPVNPSKSLVLTDEGLRRSEDLFRVLFTRQPDR